MEIPGRRSAYSLLSQFPDEPTPLASSSEWGLRITFAAGLQRQSSGSSFGESSLSGDYYALATVAMEGRPKEGSGSASSAVAKSWAQQAEETYPLQLALALRLCSDASTASDPNILDPGGHIFPAEILPTESLSHRFWVRTCTPFVLPLV
ncbi:serine/threonine-protein kinase CTR1-like [Ananas comosus]|uniref:Serine/threonine-protein kinase CTR1-like n=1 Tax=Ananas comosus TaxID=4615 RepID=A0A6P5G7H1_ANACO|nr:serine/threonine-protein kinase CTR1-like [Ananas comosus]